MTTKPTIVAIDKESAKRAADAERARIREEAKAEGIEQGIKIGERHKAAAYALGGMVAGALLMGGYTQLVSERGMFAAGAVADRIVARTVSEPGLPAAPAAADPSEEYQRNTAAARDDACRRGVRDPRTGRCPGEPGQ